MELKFVTATKPVAVDAAMQRRQRLIRRIDQQIDLINSAKDGMLPRSFWVWMDNKGTYFLPVKYGRQAIELKKGMFAIECDNVDMTIQALAHVRAMTLNGELDVQLAAASSAIRSKFTRKR